MSDVAHPKGEPVALAHALPSLSVVRPEPERALLPGESSNGVRPIPHEAREKLERLYVGHHQVIWRTLRRMGFSPDAAAESTQQAFLITVERWQDVRPGCEKAFLFSTAIRQAKTTARKNRRMDLADDLDPADLGRAADEVERRQLVLTLLDRVLNRMDTDLVAVFSLYEIEGLSSPEIAELLDVPLGTVASRLRRAREAFRACAARLEAQSHFGRQERAQTFPPLRSESDEPPATS